MYICVIVCIYILYEGMCMCNEQMPAYKMFIDPSNTHGDGVTNQVLHMTNSTRGSGSRFQYVSMGDTMANLT